MPLLIADDLVSVWIMAERSVEHSLPLRSRSVKVGL